jgi:hypothetical protein
MTIGIVQFFNIVVQQLMFHAVILVSVIIRYSYFIYKQNQKLKKENAYIKSLSISIPKHIKSEIIEMSKQLNKTWECSICLDIINVNNLNITNCGHFYHNSCINAVKEHAYINKTYAECPICRARLVKN